MKFFEEAMVDVPDQVVSVFVFCDIEKARSFAEELRKSSSEVIVWEFDNLPIVATRPTLIELDNDLLLSFTKFYPITYARIVKGIDSLLSNRVDAINISLGPRPGELLEERDPMVYAINYCFEKGILVVVAAGNAGPAEDSMQPLALNTQAISVGAVDRQRKLALVSSRGGSNSFGPTLVADGFLNQVYAKNGQVWASHCDYMTSWAAPRVASLVVLLKNVLLILSNCLENAINNDWCTHTLPLPKASIGFVDTGLDPALRGEWYLSDEAHDHANKNFIAFQFSENHRIWISEVKNTLGTVDDLTITYTHVLKALSLICIPLPKYTSQEVGMGYISDSVVKDYLTNLVPSRLLELISVSFQSDHLSELDAKLGPFWNLDFVDSLMEAYHDNPLQSMARVARED